MTHFCLAASSNMTCVFSAAPPTYLELMSVALRFSTGKPWWYASASLRSDLPHPIRTIDITVL